MNFGSNEATYKIFNSIISGQQAEKTKAQAALSDPSIDHHRLRVLILDALSREFYPRENPEDDEEVRLTRMWLLSTLGRVSNDDPEAKKVVRNHLDPLYEPFEYVRFWALEGLVAAKASDLEDLAKKIIEQEHKNQLKKLKRVYQLGKLCVHCALY